jgi:hypothetical protein
VDGCDKIPSRFVQKCRDKPDQLDRNQRTVSRQPNNPLAAMSRNGSSKPAKDIFQRPPPTFDIMVPTVGFNSIVRGMRTCENDHVLCVANTGLDCMVMDMSEQGLAKKRLKNFSGKATRTHARLDKYPKILQAR